MSIAKPVDVDDYKWELYNVAEDWSQSVNLADKQPAKLRELQDLFWIEAARNNVLPIDNSRVERFDVTNRPSLTMGRTEFTYYPGMLRIPEGSAPDVKNKSWSLTAEVDVPQTGAQGLIATHGGRFAGWGLYLLAGKPVFHYNLAGVERYSAAAKEKLAPGKHSLRMSFRYDGGGPGSGGTATLSVDGKTVAEEHFPRTIAFRMSLDETLDIGEDTGTPVSEEYRVPFAFTGTIAKVTIDLGGADAKVAAEVERQRQIARTAE